MERFKTYGYSANQNVAGQIDHLGYIYVTRTNTLRCLRSITCRAVAERTPAGTFLAQRHSHPPEMDLKKNAIKHCYFSDCRFCNVTLAMVGGVERAADKAYFPLQTWATCFSTDVIYVATCRLCAGQYVGATSRPISKRISEHLHAVARNVRAHSALARHRDRCPSIDQTSFSFSIAERLRNSVGPYDLFDREGFWMRTLRPSINDNDTSQRYKSYADLIIKGIRKTDASGKMMHHLVSFIRLFQEAEAEFRQELRVEVGRRVRAEADKDRTAYLATRLDEVLAKHLVYLEKSGNIAASANLKDLIAAADIELDGQELARLQGEAAPQVDD